MKQSIILDLPFPPSVNAVWRSNRGRVHKSKKYTDWLAEAWGCWLEQKPAQKVKSIKGRYTLEIILSPPDKRLRDLGNYDKGLSDFLQTHGIIENDYLCRKLSLAWDDERPTIPSRARLILTAC